MTERPGGPETGERSTVTDRRRKTAHLAGHAGARSPAWCVGIVVANVVANVVGSACAARAQVNPPDAANQYPQTVYVQVADARFDSYLYVKRNFSPNHDSGSLEEYFHIPHPRSKEREREFAAWRRQFRTIFSAATFSEDAQAKISYVSEEFRRATSAAECWSLDYNRERRVTVTVIGSSSENIIKGEIDTVSKVYLVDPMNFACKYSYPRMP
jgi:hypothetical protein